MKRFFTLLLLLCGLNGFAQQYNNEWIRFDQTYYKFQIATAGLYRIPKSVLDVAGIGNTPVEFLELWSNGKMVPFYPSVPTGVLPANGYLEFWGEGNDGKPDKPLYRSAASQHTDKISLISGYASYFLSVNTSQTGFQFKDRTNNPDISPLPVEPYFMHTAGNYFSSQLNPGFAAVVGEYVYSSSYDKGEYWSSSPFTPSAPLNSSIGVQAVYAAGPQSTFKYGASGNALNARTIRVSVNGSVVNDTLMDYFNDINATVAIPTSLITSGTATIQMVDNSVVTTDRVVSSYYEIIYPRLFDFGNTSNFKFELPARLAGFLLEVTNFNAGAAAPVLYDLSTGKRFIGNISVPGKVRFALPGSNVPIKYVLSSQDAANINSIATVATKKFVDYSLVANQGTFLVISHPSLYNGSTGNNPVNDYANYRQTSAGGGYVSKIVDIDELVDQFAFGIKKHPLSVKNFLRYARATFAILPKHVFLIGHGMTYDQYRLREADPVAERLNIIPTFGNPASDNMLASSGVLSPVPETPIGRLSVISAKEIEDYLEKVKQFEDVQKNSPNTIAGRQWMKNVVHVTGGGDSYLSTVLCNFMGVYKSIIEDTLFGGKVYTFCKTTTAGVETGGAERLAQLFGEGISMLNYFGHSSSTTLEFNLDNPSAYENFGKYPVFYVNGCNAGNFFTYFPQRLSVNETLSEKFVLAKGRGSIAFVASTHFGIVNYLNLFLNGLYGVLAKSESGTMGENQRNALAALITAAGSTDYYARLHAEEITFHGDPALKMNNQPKPDYVIEESLITLNPAFISIAENEFALKVKMVNIGKASPDSITLSIKRTYPDGSQETIYSTRIPGVKSADSIALTIPIVTLRDKGMNKLTVFIDSDSEIDEMSESNNIVTKEFFIFEDEARPVYPYPFSIVTDPNQKLYASTANPFSLARDYIIQMDTTELFDSPFKVSKTINSAGGIVELLPGIAYQDSAVYYWRISIVPPTGGNYQWSYSSFVFIPGEVSGFNQSHYFQHVKSNSERLSLQDSTRLWDFGNRNNDLFIRHGVYPTSGQYDNDFSVSVNGESKIASACVARSLIVNVFDPITFKPWKNVSSTGTNLFTFSSGSANCAPSRNWNFEFTYMNAVSRNNMVNFMNYIPNGAYVVVRTTDYSLAALPPSWQADTLTYGSNNSLYHKLFAAGLLGIDSITTARCFVLVYKKNDFSFSPVYRISKDLNDRIVLNVKTPTKDTLGFITSPKFGPAKEWKQLVWRGESLESPTDDNPAIDVIGIDRNNVESVIAQVDRSTQEFDLSAIDAAMYPYLKLQMRNPDSVNLTPYQLKYWRVYYKGVPEGGLASSIFFNTKDTLEAGEPIKFGIAFKNVSKLPFDSLKVKVTILDQSNVTHVIDMPRQKPLVFNDTIQLRFELDSRNYPGVNTIFVEFNPEVDQLEQAHFNNFLYKNVYVRTDNINPLLDITFDGVHILNRDIVSAKPKIQIKLKDDAKYLLLNDTTLSTIQVRYPDGMLRTFSYDNDTLRFNPATSSDDNTASIDFNPQFLKQFNPEGDEYELIVKGKDRSGNKAGQIEFRVTFKVISKPMISNLLNYPNPFSTSTAFVFTLTGSEIPQNMKIQILTVTGKIVREITMNELGPIRIGRNITEFKWNGTDQYGQKLGNGVYLYRVVTTMNGKSMEKYRSEGDNTDKFFNNGYGKMYLMR
ncbi:putative type IX secretion system sortase PorU2 [Flavitalea sp.]|nr:C25 family cysteine peptidase [Flavitalea sp.]